MDKPIKLGIVGLGRAGAGMHLNELKPRQDKFEIAAVCDIIGERRNSVAEKYGCRSYESINDLILDKDVEIVDIATRSCDHFAHAKLALEAGKDVFLEKPFCRGADEARQLIALGTQPAGPKLFIRHNRRFENAFIKVKEIIDSGILGDVFEIKLTRNGYSRRDDWQTIRKFGGGQLLNWGPHIVDHALRFCDGQYTSIYSNIKHVAAAGDCEDHIKIVFTGINGRIVDMEISGGASYPTPEYIVYGSKGSLAGSGSKFQMKYLDPKVELPAISANPETPVKQGFGPSGASLPWIDEEVTADPDGTTKIWDALYESYRFGKAFPVKLSEAAAVIEVIEKVKKDTIFA